MLHGNMDIIIKNTFMEIHVPIDQNDIERQMLAGVSFYVNKIALQVVDFKSFIIGGIGQIPYRYHRLNFCTQGSDYFVVETDFVLEQLMHYSINLNAKKSCSYTVILLGHKTIHN